MKRTIYLDHAATTPVRPEVRAAMRPYLEAEFGNPSSSHRFGRAARAAVERAREQVAHALGADTQHVVFTSGGTEADNLAILGSALAARESGRPFRVAVTSIEHKAVLDAAKVVERLGGHAVLLPVDRAGQVDLDRVRDALEQGVAVLSAMWVNNEIGTLQDVPALADLCAAHRTPFHTDAVQAVGKVPCSMDALPTTALTLSAHKLNGPKGAGALIVPDAGVVQPIIHGGSQQGGLRPGTENVAGIVGLGTAVELAVTEQPHTAAHTSALRDELERRLCAALPNATLCGADPRAPHITMVAFAGAESSALIMHLDLAGVCCSAGSACASGSVAPSHVLTALGLAPDLAMSALRFSFGTGSTRSDVDAAVAEVVHAVEKVTSVSRVPQP